MIYCGKHLISLAKDKSMNRLTRPGTGIYYSLYSATMSKVSWSIVLIKKKRARYLRQRLSATVPIWALWTAKARPCSQIWWWNLPDRKIIKRGGRGGNKPNQTTEDALMCCSNFNPPAVTWSHTCRQQVSNYLLLLYCYCFILTKTEQSNSQFSLQ